MAAPPPPSANGGFDVQPVHVQHAAALVKGAQFAHGERAAVLVDVLNKYNQSAGAGRGADAFADAYGELAAKFLEAWGRSVVSAGAAVGLNETANHYVLAEWEGRTSPRHGRDRLRRCPRCSTSHGMPRERRGHRRLAST
ncbi:hypothetical protein ABZY57_28190 [Streptomyces sp. NPDC006450]|uniref:hypothetical protein n=1 Tax=Streptomyces sp. NPDC006450 TaxID=3155458 RepID=UPI0033A75037